jgi:uracil-DNA glycosylase family 4
MAKDNKQYPPILVIGGYPNSTEDASGLSFTGKEWDFLDKTLSLLEAPYVLAHALRCHPYDPSTDTHGSKAHDHEQVKLCSNQFLAPLIEKYKPQVIVCLGSQAVAAVFGTDQVDPPSIGLFRHKVAEIDGVQVLTS